MVFQTVFSKSKKLGKIRHEISRTRSVSNSGRPIGRRPMAHVSIRDWCRSQGTPVANKDDTPLPLQGRAVSMATGLRLGLPVPCSKRRRFGKKKARDGIECESLTACAMWSRERLGVSTVHLARCGADDVLAVGGLVDALERAQRRVNAGAVGTWPHEGLGFC